MNNKEKIIQFLINKYNDSNSNPIKIDRTDISILQIPEKEIIKILNTLHEDGLIIAKPRSPHKDFSLYWEITIKTECLEYFNNKNVPKLPIEEIGLELMYLLHYLFLRLLYQ